ncbi:MAG: replication-associated recombination protein A [Clostridia bacterium]|nr:replication-associated recombination protein A [Clostridia bacterium]MBR2932930.1 replication-associated recombination protein A [Clostridia bacterium]MBR6687538.1 replication-associated recombination protein A [Clostridia bacterium]
MEDLFDILDYKNTTAPLAERMRPKTLRDFMGQDHIAEQGSLLRRAIMLDNLGSCIFWGPPGSGKTTLANIIANSTDGNFVKLNAVSSGVNDVKRVAEDAKRDLKLHGKKTYLFLDECHRFNKTQSDSLLPSIEDGTIIFIGSTTENPYAAMTPAIVSRCRVFELKTLTDEIIKKALYKAINDKVNGFKDMQVIVDDDAVDHIAIMAAGDMRVAYNALEMAVLTTPPESDGTIHVKLKDAEQSIQKKALSYDEDMYFDLLSAFCKSLRGSCSDAALYYSQRLIKGGCDPVIIARRVIAHASEDVGMADPQAMVIAVSALTAIKNMGMPEGLLPLSQAIVYVCEAEKSNSVYLAMAAAAEDAEKVKDDFVPTNLRNTPYMSPEQLKTKKPYLYPHDFGGYCEQQYMPDKLVGKKYYHPTDNGYEKTVKQIRKNKGIKD